MDLYLSSFEFGSEVTTLVRMASGRRLGFVPNALDHVRPGARSQSNSQRLGELRGLGIEAEALDLSRYFGRPDDLRVLLEQLDGLWVRGGNVFVLRKAMRLSGFDESIRELDARDFLYAGYSAGVCVLAPRLDGLELVDDPGAVADAYADPEPVWEGLGILDHLLVPHFRSDHPESGAIDRVVERCRGQRIPYRAIRDGEVIVVVGTGSGPDG